MTKKTNKSLFPGTHDITAFIISEQDGIKHLKNYIDECDGDEFARLLGELFGGECYQNIETENYTFTPNEFYGREFIKN